MSFEVVELIIVVDDQFDKFLIAVKDACIVHRRAFFQVEQL